MILFKPFMVKPINFSEILLQSRGVTMGKAITILLVAFLLTSFIIDTSQAGISMLCTINEGGGTAEFNLEITDLNSTIYNEAKNMLNETVIIEAVNPSFVEINFNDTASSIRITCSITDDRIREEVDEKKMIRIIRVETNWRKFVLPLTQNVSINFVQLLSPKVSTWNKTENGYIYHTNGDFGEVTFEIVGPGSATNFYVADDGETVIFELPLSKIDLILNSPYIILIVIIVIILVANIYRKIRYG